MTDIFFIFVVVVVTQLYTVVKALQTVYSKYKLYLDAVDFNKWKRNCEWKYLIIVHYIPATADSLPVTVKPAF